MKEIIINDEILVEDICPSKKENETHGEFLLRKWMTKMKIYECMSDAYDLVTQLRTK